MPLARNETPFAALVRRRIGWCLAVAVAMLLPAVARASGDFGCAPGWTLRHADMTGCDSMVVLGPGNDTRVNLALLLGTGRDQPAPAPRDRPPPGPLFDWTTFAAWRHAGEPDVGSASHAAGEGSRCRSDATGTAAFAAAVGAARRVSAAEREALVAARRALKPDCTGAADGAAALAAATAHVTSATGKGFVAYLHAAAAFYAGAFDAAAARFAGLTSDRDPWLRETARYMLGRVEVNRAQAGAFDEYGYHDENRPVDARAVAAAEAGLRDYLRAYPTGRYARSARGLLRRVYWLGGDTRRLAAEYVALFALAPEARGVDDAALAEEIDDKLLPRLTAADTADPTLLAVIALRDMRRGSYPGGAKPTITRAALESQRAAFAAAPALFGHLLATFALYVEGDARAVVRSIADDARAPDPDAVHFSRQVLRGIALDVLGDPKARGFWLDLLPGTMPPFRRVTVELALALHEERHAGLDRLFGSDSPVRDAALRDLLLTNVAGPDLLRRQATSAAANPHERAVALFTLLYKGLTRGGYRAFVTDIAAVPPGAASGPGTGDPPLGIFVHGPVADGFACPALRDTARRLVSDPAAATPRLCLAEFVRLNDLDDHPLDSQPPADELGGTKTLFPGAPYSRLDTYRAVIVAPASTAAERAYALFRAVRCYAPSGNNACGGAGVAKETRRAWFQRLHRAYPASRWAGELDYYW